MENHCPIGVIANSCNSLGNAVLQLFNRLSGNGYQINRTVHAISGSRHCAYLKQPWEL